VSNEIEPRAAGPGGFTSPVDWREFEKLAAAAMHRLGFRDAAITGRGTDGGIDIRASKAAAQVKARVTASGASLVSSAKC
jgi:HJR/Mrr/RecB family endonuclease